MQFSSSCNERIVLSSNRFHLPLHEAIIRELEESNYKESADYLKKLFEYDEKARTEIDSGTLQPTKLSLKDSENAIMRLKEGLIAYEQAKNAGVIDIVHLCSLIL